MNFMERLYLPAIFKGMAITFMHMFKKSVKDEDSSKES